MPQVILDKPLKAILVANLENTIGIVKGNYHELPWYVPEDLAYFKEKTLGNVIIMGYNTWLSVGQNPLRERLNVILTRDGNKVESIRKDWALPVLVDYQDTPEEVLKKVKQEIYKHYPDYIKEEYFIVGGSSIYQFFEPLVDTLYITRVMGEAVKDESILDTYKEFSLIKIPASFTEKFTSESLSKWCMSKVGNIQYSFNIMKKD